MAAKKVVRVDTGAKDEKGPEWRPEPEAKSRATRFRLIAGGLWLVALAIEGWAIFGLINDDDLNIGLLIGAIVVIGALSITGSVLWKKANRLDPARRSDPVRFFIQNQLGAIIAIIAFLPLIVLIFLDKDLDSKQKGIIGGIAIAVMAIATYTGVDTDPASVEQYTEESNLVTNYRPDGKDLVYWTKEGEVFHLCDKVSAVNRESKDGQIYEGTVAEAHAAGKDRLTKQVASEARQCGWELPETDQPADRPGEDTGDVADEEHEPSDAAS